jgi:hypothetical protein
MCDAVADQRDYARRRKHDAGLTDILVVSLVLSDARRAPEPREIALEGINAFASIGLNEADCQALLARAEGRIALVHEALK